MIPQISHLILKNRALEKIRGFFHEEKIPEVSTPLLVKSGAIEPYLDTFEVAGGRHLPTSPEFSLKKMAAIESPQVRGIYEIAHAFRNEPASDTHLQEFLMVEWYRRQSDNLALAADIAEMVGRMASLYPEAAIKTGDSKNLKIITVSELFDEAFGQKPQPGWGAGEYEDLAKQAKILLNPRQAPEVDRITGAFSALFDEAARKVFTKPELSFVQNFPPQVRGMAVLNSQGWAARMEAFIGDVEIASGYRELSDPEELEKLWQANNRLRIELGKKPHPLDLELIALTPHMEGVAGMALGLERTLAAVYHVDQINKFTLA